MSKNLKDKVIVVTGGSNGIGRAICECFLECGAIVVAADLSAPLDLCEWKQRCGEKVDWVKANVTETDSVKSLAKTVGDQFGGVDALINNAGIMFEKSIDEQSETEWDLMMAVNLKGPMLVTKYLLPLLRARAKKNGGAAIVNIGSIESYACNPNHTAYAASKGGVHGLTVAMAVDLGPQGIRVNAIAPGWIDTDLNRRYVESAGNAARAKTELEKLHPVGYIGGGKDVGDAAVWLASGESRFVSGQLITADGARTKQLSLPKIFRK